MHIDVDSGRMFIPVASIRWQPPPVLAKNGDGAPIIAPYYTCSLSVNLTTVVEYTDWLELRDSELHTFLLPHPATGTMTSFSAYVDIAGGTFNVRGDCAVMSGFDITLSRITVTIGS